MDLPEFTVNDAWAIFDEGYGDSIQSGLIALAVQRDIEEVLEEPWSEWDQETQEWKASEYGEAIAETRRQFSDEGKLVRNEFTGLAVYTLLRPVRDIEEIRFSGPASVRAVTNMARPGMHTLEESVIRLSHMTGVPVEILRNMYVGDYFALHEESERLTPAPSSPTLPKI